jgi:hypothetical protein
VTPTVRDLGLQRLWLAPDVHAVAIETDVVFLDIAADAYLCLADAAACLRMQPDGAIIIDPPRAADELLAAGLLSTTPALTSPSLAPAIARGLPVARPSLTPRTVQAALAANAKASAAIRGLTFTDILALAGGLDEAALSAPSNALLEEAARFARMAPWLPRDGLCLMRSLQQRLYLTRRGLSAAWVFGVRTWPFEAHCWLQAGDVVLDDTAEHAGAYTPILVV